MSEIGKVSETGQVSEIGQVSGIGQVSETGKVSEPSMRHFDPDAWRRRCAELAGQRRYDAWLLGCLAELGQLAPEILEADQQREPEPEFDMTYPH